MPEREDYERAQKRALPFGLFQWMIGSATVTLCLRTRELHIFPYIRECNQEGWYFTIGEYVLVRELLIKWLFLGLSIIRPLTKKEEEAWQRKKL